jgi:hypothetical protein
MKRHPRHIIIDGRRWTQRYFSGVSDKNQRVSELIKRRRTPYSKLSLGPSNIGIRTQKSKWTLLFHKVYPDLKFDKNLIAQKTGIPRASLNTVYDRGLKAWKTSGSRPGATAAQWAIARVYKFVLVSKKKAPEAWYRTKFDPNNNLRH